MFNKYKIEVEKLSQQNKILVTENDSHLKELSILKSNIQNLTNKIGTKDNEIRELKNKLNCDSIIAEKQKLVNELELKIEDLSNRQHIQTLGFFELQYDSRYYKDELSKCRQAQKRMLIDKTYFKSLEDWFINGDLYQGRKLLEFFLGISITSFNLSCDAWLENTTIVNCEFIKNKINRIWNNYNSELNNHKVELNMDYLKLKLDELDIRLNIYIKLQQEKEEERRQKEIIREQAKAELELTKNKEKLEKELIHYQLQANKGVDVTDKIKEIEARIETDDFMLTKTRAGYVYIIQSKSFSDKNQWKIGMTRQLNPMDRLAQLSDASIPFKYYPCALIFTEDAFELETKLHRRLVEYKVNKFNQRKEHFIIDRDELLKVLNDEFHLNVQFKDIVDEEWLFSIDNGLNM